MNYEPGFTSAQDDSPTFLMITALQHFMWALSLVKVKTHLVKMSIVQNPHALYYPLEFRREDSKLYLRLNCKRGRGQFLFAII